jgi:hypothetical protein
MRSRFSTRSPFVNATAAFIVVLIVGMLVVPTAFASPPHQQYQTRQSDPTALYCAIVFLVIVVPATFWMRSKIRSEADLAGSFNKTIEVTQPPDAVVTYINKNYDRSSKGGRDWSRRWLSKNPPAVQLSTWYPKYSTNCLFMILLGVLPYIVLREVMGGRSERIYADITPNGGGSVVRLRSVGRVGYEEAGYLADALGHMAG